MRKEIVPKKIYCFGVHVYDEYGYRNHPYSEPKFVLPELKSVEADQIEFNTNAEYTVWIRGEHGELELNGEGNFFQYKSFRDFVKKRIEAYENF